MNPNPIEAPIYDSLERLHQHLRQCAIDRWLYISDSNVSRHFREALLEQGGLGWIEFPAGEESKNLQQVHDLYQELSRFDVDRQTAIVAVGGGVVGDLVGFVAATYLRGLPLVQVPTTVVAMVDSALGGKVGVDVAWGKNLVGSFWPARCIICDTNVLKTLPDDDFAGGMAEVIKHALLEGHQHLAEVEAMERGNAAPLLEKSAGVKLRHVLADPYEKGIRAHLNLGHTLGHALEVALAYRGLTHGQAVAIGLVAALRLSRDAGLLEEDFEERLERLLRRWRLPTRVPTGVVWSDVEAALLRDKKNQSGRLRYVLVRAPGRVETQFVSLDSVRKVFDSLCASSS